jgi:hypothetical protein
VDDDGIVVALFATSDARSEVRETEVPMTRTA